MSDNKCETKSFFEIAYLSSNGCSYTISATSREQAEVEIDRLIANKSVVKKVIHRTHVDLTSEFNLNKTFVIVEIEREGDNIRVVCDTQAEADTVASSFEATKYKTISMYRVGFGQRFHRQRSS